MRRSASFDHSALGAQSHNPRKWGRSGGSSRGSSGAAVGQRQEWVKLPHSWSCPKPQTDGATQNPSPCTRSPMPSTTGWLPSTTDCMEGARMQPTRVQHWCTDGINELDGGKTMGMRTDQEVQRKNAIQSTSSLVLNRGLASNNKASSVKRCQGTTNPLGPRYIKDERIWPTTRVRETVRV